MTQNSGIAVCGYCNCKQLNGETVGWKDGFIWRSAYGPEVINLNRMTTQIIFACCKIDCS